MTTQTKLKIHSVISTATLSHGSERQPTSGSNTDDIYRTVL
jgi:hypothetical protein